MSVDPISLLVLVGTISASWGGAKVALNGTKKRVQEIQASIVEHTKSDTEVQQRLAYELATSRLEVTDRLARIEEKLDGLKNRRLRKTT